MGITWTLFKLFSLERKKMSWLIHVSIFPPLFQVSLQGGFDEKSTGKQLVTILDISALGPKHLGLDEAVNVSWFLIPDSLMSLCFLVLGNFNPIRRDRHFVFLFPFHFFHSPAQCLQFQAPSSTGIFLEVLPITIMLFPSELAALGCVHFVFPRVLPLFWFIPVSG